MSYLHREITVEFQLFLATEITTSIRGEVKDGDEPISICQKTLGLAANIFNQALALTTLPSDPEPGDQPMVHVEVSYMQVTDGGDVETFSFAVTEIESISSENRDRVVDDAASKVFKIFTRRAAQMIQEVA